MPCTRVHRVLYLSIILGGNENFLFFLIFQIYIMDIHIWYTLLSAIIGGVMGARARLGEVLILFHSHESFIGSLILMNWMNYTKNCYFNILCFSEFYRCLACLLVQIRSIEMVHKRFESFPEAFVKNLVSPDTKRWFSNRDWELFNVYLIISFNGIVYCFAL